MEEIRNKIMQLGAKKNINALKEYVENLDTEELTSLISEYICERNGLLIWNYLLQSFTESIESHNKRFQICMTVLKVLEEDSDSNSQNNDIICTLQNEFAKFKANHLIDICEFCIERIQKGYVLQTTWKDLLPQTLDILVEKDCVTYNNSEMTGEDFKKQIISSLCMINWSPNIVTPLVVMFRDISVTEEEHLQIVIKFCNIMDKLTCLELPAFVYQLLEFCSFQNSRCIFLKLQYYFSKRIYKNLGKYLNPSSSSQSSDLDSITDVSEYDALQVESTILFHIHQSATFNHGINDYIKSLKNMLKAPEFVLHPFQVSVLLIISTVFFEEQALEILRSCVVRSITEDHKRSESAWFKSIASSSSEVSNIMSAVIENSIRERPLVVSGLINFSFVLLKAGAALGSKNIAEAQWQLGTFILLKLMKKKTENSNTVVQELCNRILMGENVPHLSECLHQMCRNLTLTMLEYTGAIIQLIEQILQLPGATARGIVDAVTPLVKVSSRIRDNLILILRKALYSRKIETRQIAVNGFLKILKTLRISNMTALSQSDASSRSNYSFLTQLSLDCQMQQSTNKFHNEAICLEVLGILRRCLMQQAEVRTELYNCLQDSVCLNTELGVPALDMLLSHFNQFCNSDENVLPPLNFTKTILTKNTEVIIQEPLGRLIFTIGLILIKVKDIDDSTNPTNVHVAKILANLCQQMTKCEPMHFELDNGKDLLDNSLDCQADLLILKQIMSVYEALMGYLIYSWEGHSENTAQNVYSLFQAYCRFVEFSKNLHKPKKAEGRKKAKDDTLKNKTAVGKSKLLFKPLPTVLDFPVICKILSLLHEPTVSWAGIAESNILKVKREFHQYVLQTSIQLAQNVKTSKCMETIHTKPYFNYCTQIAVILHERVLNRLEYVIDFDCTTAVLAVENFHVILHLIVTYYKEKLNRFLSTLVKQSDDENIGDKIMPFIEKIQCFFEKHENEYSDDPEGKKLPGLFSNILSILVTNLPADGVQLNRVIDWLKKLVDEKEISNKQVASNFVTILLNVNVRCKTTSNIYENVALRLCNIFGTIDNEEIECPMNLKLLNGATAVSTLTVLTNALKMMLNETDWIIQRFRAKYNMIIYPGVEKIERRREILKEKERSLCCHIIQIVKVCSLISKIVLPRGTNADVIFKILIHYYNTLNLLTKYFLYTSSKLNPAFQSARFEGVLKLSGKPLSNIIYNLISHVEESLASLASLASLESLALDDDKSKSSNILKTKTLRDTRSIPKLIYEMEQFSRNVITLTNKTKIDLTRYIGIGTARDFRINENQLQDVLANDNNADDTNMDTTEDTSVIESDAIMDNDDEEETNGTTSMDVDEDENESNEGSEEEQPQPKKKSRAASIIY